MHSKAGLSCQQSSLNGYSSDVISNAHYSNATSIGIYLLHQILGHFSILKLS